MKLWQGFKGNSLSEKSKIINLLDGKFPVTIHMIKRDKQVNFFFSHFRFVLSPSAYSERKNIMIR